MNLSFRITNVFLALLQSKVVFLVIRAHFLTANIANIVRKKNILILDIILIFLIDIALDTNQFGFCDCSLIPGVENHGPKPPLIRDVIHICENNSDERKQNFDFELMQEKFCIPEHLVDINNKFFQDIKKDKNDLKNDLIDEKIDEEFSEKFNLDTLTSDANTISRETESTISSSTDSSTSTTSDSNVSVLSSSSSSSASADSDQESEDEKNEIG